MTELQSQKLLAHLNMVGRFQAELLDVFRQLNIFEQSHHLSVEIHHLCVALQSFFQLRALLLGISQDAPNVAVALNELRSSFLADARHARQVIRGVASHGGVIHILAGRNARLLHDFRLVHQHRVGHASARRIQHAHMRVFHQLECVSIAAHHHGSDAVLSGLSRTGCQHIIGFHPGYLQVGYPASLQQIPQPFQLHDEIRRSSGTGGLVSRDLFVAKSRPRRVKRHSQILRLMVAHEIRQHRHEAIHRAGGFAVATMHLVFEGVIGAVGHGVPVNDHESFGPRAHFAHFASRDRLVASKFCGSLSD